MSCSPQRLNKLSRTNTPYLFKPIEIIYVCVGRIGRLSSFAQKVGYKNLEIAFAQFSQNDGYSSAYKKAN